MSDKTKKLINKVEDCVDESIDGYIAVNSGLCTLSGYKRIIVRSDLEEFKKSNRVTTITGGGSGHEPSFMGWVGDGMMTCAVHGSLFASPSPSTILAALRAVGSHHPAGVLVLINNYTGDRLNFGIAVERARMEGIKTEIVINADDCSIHTKDKTAGRRGLAGCIFLMKIVGNLAEKGESLEYIKQISTETTAQIATMGVCWLPCSLPGGSPIFNLGPDEMELGLGIHGEAGVKRLKIQSAHDTVVQILTHMLNPENPFCFSLHKDDKVALLINNLGSASDIELNIAANEAIMHLEKHIGVSVERAYAGRYVTSQEMAGLSITLMILNELRSQCLDEETRAVSWVKPLLPNSCSARFIPEPLELLTCDKRDGGSSSLTGPQMSQDDFEHLLFAICKACEVLIKNKDLLNSLDSGSGDGDCGSTLACGADAILKKLSTKELVKQKQLHILLLLLAETAEETMGGCSGALYSLLLTSVANQMQHESSCDTESWMRSLKSGLDTITRYGGAEPGDRTMIDPLNEAWKTLSELVKSSDKMQCWTAAVQAAEAEAERTVQMVARAGRASYVNRDQLNQPDPGAKAVSFWMRAILDSYTEKK